MKKERRRARTHFTSELVGTTTEPSNHSHSPHPSFQLPISDKHHEQAMLPYDHAICPLDCEWKIDLLTENTEKTPFPTCVEKTSQSHDQRGQTLQFHATVFDRTLFKHD